MIKKTGLYVKHIQNNLKPATNKNTTHKHELWQIKINTIQTSTLRTQIEQKLKGVFDPRGVFE